MLNRKDILAGRYRRPYYSDQAVEYGIDLRLREQHVICEEQIKSVVFSESAVYERLANNVWHHLYGDLIAPVHELIDVVKHKTQMGDPEVRLAVERVLDVLAYREE